MRYLIQDKYLFSLLILSSIILYVYLELSPIDYECDANLFYLNGKTFYELIFGVEGPRHYSYRPFIFPFFMIFSGVYSFNSFTPLILTHSVLTILCVYLIYSSLKNINIIFAFFGSLIFIFSSIFFVHIKSGLEIHLLTFLYVLNIYSFINFYKKKSIFWFYFVLIFSLVAFFTRFDTIFILLFDIFFLNIILFLKFKNLSLKKKILTSITSFIIVFSFILIWMLAKFVYFYKYAENDYERSNFSILLPSMTSLNHQTGAQLLWRLNSDLRPTLQISENAKFKYQNLLKKENGQYSQQLYNILLEAVNDEGIWKYINTFEDLMYPIGPNEVNLTPKENFFNHYGRFEADRESLVKNFFSNDFESFYYPLHIPMFLNKKIGRIQSDKLLQKVGKEIILSESKIIYQIFRTYISAFGIFYEKGEVTVFENWGGITWYNIIPINIGGCAKNGLSKKMYQQYENEYYENSLLYNEDSKKLKVISGYLRDTSRNLFGLILLFLLPFIFIGKNKTIGFTLLTKLLFTIFIISIFSGIVNTKYENYLLVFIMFIVFIAINNVIYLLKSINHKKDQPFD